MALEENKGEHRLDDGEGKMTGILGGRGSDDGGGIMVMASGEEDEWWRRHFDDREDRKGRVLKGNSRTHGDTLREARGLTGEEIEDRQRQSVLGKGERGGQVISGRR